MIIVCCRYHQQGEQCNTPLALITVSAAALPLPFKVTRDFGTGKSFNPVRYALYMYGITAST